MKKMILSTVLSAAALMLCSATLATPAVAQQGGGRGMQTPDAQLASLTTALTLSADQQAKIKPILEADAKAMADLRAAQDPDMRTKSQAIRTAQHEKIKALLTAEQAAKYDAMPQGGRGGGGGGGNQ